jgi:hypothetical protein
MNEESSRPGGALDTRGVPDTRAFASDEQRRQVLRAAVAGSALAGLPFAANATNRPHCRKDNKNYHPTASAVGSLIASATGSVDPIKGHNCNHYRQAGSWTGWTCTNGSSVTMTFDKCANQYPPGGVTKLRFHEVFQISYWSATTAERRDCEEILRSYSTTEQAHFLVAIFNANKRNVAPAVFPYNPAGVISLYKGVNPLPNGIPVANLRNNAMILFRDYLSTEA